MWYVYTSDKIDSVHATRRSAVIRMSELLRRNVEDVYVKYDEGATTNV